MCATSLKFLEYAPAVFLSAKTGAGVNRIFKLIREVYESATKRVTTGELNRFVERLRFEERKIYYITQASVRPPTFVLFTNRVRPAALLRRTLSGQPDPQSSSALGARPSYSRPKAKRSTDHGREETGAAAQGTEAS